MRAAQAAVKLEKFTEALEFCDKGLAQDKENRVLIMLREQVIRESIAVRLSNKAIKGWVAVKGGMMPNTYWEFDLVKRAVKYIIPLMNQEMVNPFEIVVPQLGTMGQKIKLRITSTQNNHKQHIEYALDEDKENGYLLLLPCILPPAGHARNSIQIKEAVAASYEHQIALKPLSPEEAKEYVIKKEPTAPAEQITDVKP